MGAQDKAGVLEERKALVEEILEAYPDKSKKKRQKHLGVFQEGSQDCGVKSNIKSVPGVMTARGCAYAGSKGVVWGPVKNAIHLSHGPVGCGVYSWSGRRNYYVGMTGVDTFGTLNFTSDFQERDIVFGGDKRLEALLKELSELFPLAEGFTVQSECPVGLIGDDIEAVSRKMGNELGKPVTPVRCEGFRGVSQSLGHHIANDSIRDWIMPKAEQFKKDLGFEPGPYDVAIVGDYNIGGDAWASRILLEEMGLRVVSVWTGDATLKELALMAFSKLNLIHCYRSINYITRFVEETYGVPWIEFNFFGPTMIAKSLRVIASHFDETIQENAEKLIARYEPEMGAITERYKPRLKDKRVLLYVGGLRPRHTIPAFEDLGMEVMGTGYEFGHKDDYQRTTEHIKEGTVVYDDVTAYEMEALVKALKPDLVASGIKEKYVFQKMGIPFRQMHSWDYSGPYHGYDGFKVFARDMDMAINNPAWSLIQAPWRRA